MLRGALTPHTLSGLGRTSSGTRNAPLAGTITVRGAFLNFYLCALLVARLPLYLV